MLVLAGYHDPAENVIACNLRQYLIDEGHKLFWDNEQTSGITFLATDTFYLAPGRHLLLFPLQRVSLAPTLALKDTTSLKRAPTRFHQDRLSEEALANC